MICLGIKDSNGHRGKLCRKEEQLVFGRRYIGQKGVGNVRTNEKVYILDSDISLKDVTWAWGVHTDLWSQVVLGKS